MKPIWKICAAIMALCMLAVAIISATIGYCGGVLECGTSSVPMHCYYAYHATIGIGIAGTVMGVFGFFAKSAEARKMCALAFTLLALAAAAVLYMLVGVCSITSMGCYRSRLLIVAVLLIGEVAAVVGATRADDTKAKRPKAKL